MNRLPYGIDRLLINILCRAKKELSIGEIIIALSEQYAIKVPNKHNLTTRVCRLAKSGKIIRRENGVPKMQCYKSIEGQKPDDDSVKISVAAGTVVKIKGKPFRLVHTTTLSGHPKNFKVIK